MININNNDNNDYNKNDNNRSPLQSHLILQWCKIWEKQILQWKHSSCSLPYMFSMSIGMFNKQQSEFQQTSKFQNVQW